MNNKGSSLTPAQALDKLDALYEQSVKALRSAIGKYIDVMTGDEYRDYTAAIMAGMHPFVVSYGFEDYDRLVGNFSIPREVISKTPRELMERVCHALDLDPPRLKAQKSAVAEP